jgi:hypothetical protein
MREGCEFYKKGRLLMKTGDYEEAISLFRRSAEMEPHFKTFANCSVSASLHSIGFQRPWDTRRSDNPQPWCQSPVPSRRGISKKPKL